MLRRTFLAAAAAALLTSAAAVDSEPFNNTWRGSDRLSPHSTVSGRINRSTDKDFYHLDVARKTGTGNLVAIVNNRGSRPLTVRVWSHRTKDAVASYGRSYTIQPGKRQRITAFFSLDKRDMVGVYLLAQDPTNYNLEMEVR